MTWYYDREYLDAYRTGKEIRMFGQSSIINRSCDETLKIMQSLATGMANCRVDITDTLR